MKMLTHRGEIGGEIRPIYFLKHFGMPVPQARIMSFGACNFACPYCKRDGQFRGSDGSIITSIAASWTDIESVVRDAVAKGQTVRLSGGDPVMFPSESERIARLVKELGGVFSMAHNGSSPRFALKMADCGLHSAAIDLKSTRRGYGEAIGNSCKQGRMSYDRSLETQRVLAGRGVYVDVRTPVFGHTSLDDMLELASDISKASGHRTFWTWRLYKPVQGCDWSAPDQNSVTWMIHQVKAEFPSLPIGLRAKWEPEGFLYF